MTRAPDRLERARRIEAAGMVAVIRCDDAANLLDLCTALAAGGISAIEVTMTTPGALDAIARATAALGASCLIGAGTVLDVETCRATILAGAQFVVAPNFNPAVITAAHRYGCPMIPGCMTPTEILSAWEAGADLVKVFPARCFTPTYFRDLLAPMPQLKLLATHAELDTIPHWIKSGAACLSVSTTLVKPEWVKARNWPALTTLARQFVDAVGAARAAQPRA